MHAPLATMLRRVELAMDSLHATADELVTQLERLPNRNAAQEDALDYARKVRALAETCID